MASPARSMAARVSLLIFAASIEYICCSRVATCAVVCSRVCSCCFFLRRAAFAAISSQSRAGLMLYICGYDMMSLDYVRSKRGVMWTPEQPRTILVGAHVLPSYCILFVHLVLQMSLALLQHLKLRSETKDSILGCILLLLGTLPSKPTPHSRHLAGSIRID